MNHSLFLAAGVLMFALLTVPGAEAGPLDCDFTQPVTVCMNEESDHDDPCSEDGGFEHDMTEVFVYVPGEETHVGVRGIMYCYQSGDYSSESNSVSVMWATPLGWGYLFWSESDNAGPGYTFTLCSFDLYHDMEGIGEDYHSNACPAGLGPPNPGWGDALPELPA